MDENFRFNSYTGISMLTSKLGHSLEEIRVRSLKSIVFKIDHGLIREEDLVHDEGLFRNLLQWFNFPKSPHKDNVLQLLSRLCKHSSACSNLKKIGGYSFLCHLRPDLEDDLKELVDEIIHCLSGQENVSEDDLIFYHRTNQFLPGKDDNIGPDIPYHMFQPSLDYYRHVTSTGSASDLFNYFEGTETLPSHKKNVCGMQITLFPWANLTSQDLQVISSTNRSLQSGDSESIQNSCRFLCDVMLKDYPAEIFLQRPAISQTLLGFLTEDYQGHHSIVVSALEALNQLLNALHKRISFYLDPNYFCLKTERHLSSSLTETGSSCSSEHSFVPSEDAFRSEEGSRLGDGDDNPLPSGSYQPLSHHYQGSVILNHTEEESCLLSLEDQLTLPYFLGQCVSSMVSLLKNDCLHTIAMALKGVLSALKMLKTTLTLDFWEDQSNEALAVHQFLIHSLQELGICLDTHRNNYLNKDDICKYRHIYLMLAICVGNFLDGLVPIKNVSQVLPVSLCSNLKELIFDEPFRVIYNDIHSCFLQYLEAIEPSFCVLFKLSEEIHSSMKAACNFLKQFSGRKEVQDISFAYRLVEESMLCFPYIQNHEIVNSFISLFSESSSKVDELLNKNARRILLKMLGHPVLAIKIESHKCCRNIVKNALDHREVSNINENSFEQIKFIIQKDVLLHLSCCGLQEASPVFQECLEIYCILLNSRWVVNKNCWEVILRGLVHALPALQGFVSFESELGKSLLSLTNPDTLDGFISLSRVEGLRCCLRNLFLQEKKVRYESFMYIIVLLHHQKDFNSFKPILERGADKDSLANILFYEFPHELRLSSCKIPSPSEVDTFRTLFDIVLNEKMEPEVQASSLQQVMIFLESKKLHSTFIQMGGEKYILNNIVLSVKNEVTEELTNLLLISLKILRSLIIYLDSFRNSLALNEELQFSLIRCLILYSSQAEIKTVLIDSIFILIFNEFVTIKEESKLKLYLPIVIVQRYRVPFLCYTNDLFSDFHLTVTPKEYDSLNNGKPSERLTACWNFAWHGSILGYVQVVPEDGGSVNTVAQKNIEIARITDYEILVQKLLCDVINASTHREVKQTLHLLSILVLSVQQSSLGMVLNGNSWKEAFDRFFKLTPSCPADENLLKHIVSFFTLVVHKISPPPMTVIQWLCSRATSSGPCQQMIMKLNISGTSSQESFSNLIGDILKFLITLTVVTNEESFCSQVSYSLHIGLNLAGTPQFYSLPLLEKILTCLIHTTSHPGWSTASSSPVKGMDLCRELLSSLMEIVTAFHFGPGSTAGLCMGRGVTRSAAICLHQLAEEMARIGHSQWESYWLHEQHTREGLRNLGLSWLLPLWTDPDPEIRAAGLGTAVSLTLSIHGLKLLMDHLQQLVGGVWGAALSFLLDHQEASSVREEAALLLCNLTSWMNTSTGNDSWQGPFVRDVDSQVPLSGLPALQAILHHCEFYKELAHIFTNVHFTLKLPVSVMQQLIHSRTYEQDDSDIQDVDSRTLTTAEVNNTSSCNTPEQIYNNKNTLISYCTPSLVSAVCQLLKNLIKLNPYISCEAIQESQLCLLLLKCLNRRKGSKSNNLYVGLGEVSELSCSVLSLLSVCVKRSPSIRNDLVEHTKCFTIIIDLLKNHSEEPDLLLFSEVWKFLSIFLKAGNSAAYKVVCSAVSKQWDVFQKALTVSLKDKNYECRTTAIHSLCFLAHWERKLRGSLADDVSFADLLDTVFEDDSDLTAVSEENVSLDTLGALLSTILVTKVKSTSSVVAHEENTETLMAGLAALFSVSGTAKASALNFGFMEHLLKEIVQITTLTKGNFSKVKGSSGSKTITNLSVSLTSRFEILQNFLYQFPTAKKKACKLGLIGTLLKLWNFCLANSAVLTSCLRLLLNYTADCIEACQSVAKCSTVSGGTTLTHHLVDLAQQEHKKLIRLKESPNLQLVFQILSNVALVSDLRKTISKVNFLDLFVSLSNIPTQKGNHIQLLQQLWLQLLLTLTSSAEGQKMVATTKGALDLILDWANSACSEEVQRDSLLVLRNLCFLSSNKACLLATGKFLPLLMSLLESPSSKVCLLVGSTLWALLANYQKAKSLIRGTPGLELQIHHTLKTMNLVSDDESAKAVIVFENVISILNRKD